MRISDWSSDVCSSDLIRPADAAQGVDPKQLERVTAAAFGQRHKMLRPSLKGLPGALEAFEKTGIESQRRAQTVHVAECIEIARALLQKGAIPNVREACREVGGKDE